VNHAARVSVVQCQRNFLDNIDSPFHRKRFIERVEIGSMLFRTRSFTHPQLVTPGPGDGRSTFANAKGETRELSGEFGRYRIRSALGQGGMGTGTSQTIRNLGAQSH